MTLARLPWHAVHMDSAEPERIGQDVLVERTSETTPIWTPGSISSALQSPIRQISENAGVGGSIVVGRVMNERSGSFGYNAQSNDYCDMIEHGIIDPAKVVRVALQDAASIAGLMIATEAGVAALQADLHPEGAAHALLPAWGPHSDRSSPLTIDGREGGNQHA